jgi:hypothetical protein
MMKGITILSENEIMNMPTWALVITIIGLIIFAISFTIIVICSQKIIQIIFGINSICFFILFIFGVFCMSFVENPTGKYEYKVTI